MLKLLDFNINKLVDGKAASQFHIVLLLKIMDDTIWCGPYIERTRIDKKKDTMDTIILLLKMVVQLFKLDRHSNEYILKPFFPQFIVDPFKCNNYSRRSI